jgi:D-methionine transport system permease protein
MNEFFELLRTTGMALGTWQTVYMVSGATLIAYLIGLPLGVLLILTDPQGLYPRHTIHRLLQSVINLFR